LDGGSAADAGGVVSCPDHRTLKNAYFGDLHAHTSYSLDAYSAALTRNTPFDAYAFARGRSLQIAGAQADGGGPTTTIARPLDFRAVPDHSEWLVATYGCGTDLAGTPYDPTSPFSADLCAPMSPTGTAWNGKEAFLTALCDGGACPTVYQSAWQSEQSA